MTLSFTRRALLVGAILLSAALALPAIAQDKPVLRFSAVFSEQDIRAEMMKQFGDAIAGVEDPPGPDEVRRLADTILRGVFSGDLAVALERAGAFCRVVATGSAFEAQTDEGHADDRAHRTTLRASQLLRTGEDLERCAALWRDDKLD